MEKREDRANNITKLYLVLCLLITFLLRVLPT